MPEKTVCKHLMLVRVIGVFGSPFCVSESLSTTNASISYVRAIDERYFSPLLSERIYLKDTSLCYLKTLKSFSSLLTTSFSKLFFFRRNIVFFSNFVKRNLVFYRVVFKTFWNFRWFALKIFSRTIPPFFPCSFFIPDNSVARKSLKFFPSLLFHFLSEVVGILVEVYVISLFVSSFPALR